MKLYKIIFLLAYLALSSLFTSCGLFNDDDDISDNESPADVKQMTLIYAVNNNNLSADLKSNEKQILSAMKDVDIREYKLLLYKYTSDGPGLFEVTRGIDGECEFSKIKSYDNSILSASKERMAEVISDALDRYPDMESNLFFWGHGNGWVNSSKYPNTSSASAASVNTMFSYENMTFSSTVNLPEVHSFGGEYYYENEYRKSEYLDINLMAEAIPDHTFDLIWFDCCYMSSIEVIYQLRDKCSTLVAYPTEIMAEGLPYHLVMPHIIGSNKNLPEAAGALYEYYIGKSTPEPVTVAVMDMQYIDDLADAARNIFSLGEIRPNVSSMQNYSRFYNVPYYDFGQYLRSYAAANEGSTVDNATVATSVEALNNSLKKFVVYSAASDLDFSYPVGKKILPENFSGISIHPYAGVKTYREDFYRSLDWFEAAWN